MRGQYKVLKGGVGTRGYRHIALTSDKKLKTYRISRLVAAAFVTNPENKPEVNHINGIKLDNRSTNLEWCTRGENVRHGFRIGLYTNTNYPGERNSNAKLNNKQARLIRHIKEIDPLLSNRKIAKIFKVSEHCIKCIVNRTTYINA